MVKHLHLPLEEKEYSKLAKLKGKTGLNWVQFFLWLAEMKKHSLKGGLK